VHRQFASTHSSHRWRGSTARFGDAAAILAGDLCLVWADEMLHDSGMSAEHLFAAAPVYNAMRERTVRGQYLDILTQAHRTPRPADPWRIAVDKTAANTTCGPLAFGAALAGATEEIRATYEAYAAPLGVAFQLRDDLLGAFGQFEVTGKPSGDDLRDGKRTLLIARARQLGDDHTTRRIDELLQAGSVDAVEELRALLESTGARRNIEDLIAELGRRSTLALDAKPIHPQAKRVLRGLAASLTTATEG
jgi:geranylgeranyl diphosphate synthase, type I